MLLHPTGGAMKQLTEAEVLARYEEVLESVAKDGGEVVVTRSDGSAVVMVALADYEALTETAHLLRSPSNANRLLDAMGRLEANGLRQKNLLLALKDPATEVGGVDVAISPRDSPTLAVDLS